MTHRMKVDYEDTVINHQIYDYEIVYDIYQDRHQVDVQDQGNGWF